MFGPSFYLSASVFCSTMQSGLILVDSREDNQVSFNLSIGRILIVLNPLLLERKNRMKKTAAWLRERVLQLGPTFIKLGQLSSTRSDLFPREFVDELAKLQDRVPAFSPEKARDFIAGELGAPVEVVFKEFEDRPIAAASLGQVHRAILHNGEKVVVKVQRPGLKKLFDIDLSE
ncbi:Protein ACTIVITY OF BC1 COMPLEX KINASE 7, chloroplastic [Dionaea muscipula]